jgi:exonuclease SbcD
MLHLFHTADWHLGQTFFDYDRDFEHARFLDWLLSALAEHRPDALLLAGDVFDNVNPSAQAQRQFYDFLNRAHAAHPHLQFVITAGNHDAAARLEAPSALLAALNISVIGTVPRDASGGIEPARFVVPLKNAAGQVEALAVAVPFLRPADVPLLPATTDPYLEGIKELYRLATAAAVALRDERYPGAAIVALGHCHLAGGESSTESERPLIIGGSEALKPDTFPAELAYVALGHLHKPQSIDGGRIRYCGSPIPLSFSEKDYGHRVLRIAIDGGQLASVEPLAIPATAPLLRIPARGALGLDALLAKIADMAFDADLPVERHPFLEVHVLDEGPDPTRNHRIKTALEGKPVRLASTKLAPMPRDVDDTTTGQPANVTLADLSSLDPEGLLNDTFLEKYQNQPAPALLAALREILLAESTAQPTDGPVAR